MGDMLEAINKDEADRYKVQHQLLAWQTALLMNSTGNYKKKIKPEDLLGKEDKEESEGNGVNRLDRDVKNRELEDLQNKFNTIKQSTN